MRTTLRGLEHASHLVRLGASVRALLQAEGAQRGVAKDAMTAHLAHLLEAEVPPELDRLFEAERMRAPPRLLEQLPVHRHRPPRYATRGSGAMPSRAVWRAGSLSLEDGRDALSEADAHRGEPEAALAASELMEEGGRQARAAAAERVPECHRAAVHVHLLLGDLELARTGEGLAGERLVDLHQVHLIDAQPRPLERLLAGRHRAPAHDLGVDPGDRGGADGREHGKPQLLRPLTRHEQHRGGAVADL